MLGSGRLQGRVRTAARRATRARARCASHLADTGITIIEVLVAFSILLLVTVPLGYMFDNLASQAANARARVEALDIAEQWVETLSNNTPPTNASCEPLIDEPNLAPTIDAAGQPCGTVASSVASTTQGGTVFHLSSLYTWSSAQAGKTPDLCQAGVPQVLALQVKVTWGTDQNQSLTDSTVLNYPPAGIQTLGFFALQFFGDNSQENAAGTNPWTTRVQAVTVTLTGPQTIKLHPDSSGCVFAELKKGSYTVTVTNATAGLPASSDNFSSPSFVANLAPAAGTDHQPQTVTLSNQVVNEGVVTYQTVNYDQGSNVNLVYPDLTAVADSVSCPGKTSLECVATGTTSSGASVAWGSSGSWSAGTTTSADRIAQVACSTSNVCVAVGDAAASTPTGVILSTTTGSPWSNIRVDSVPAGVTDITSVTCPTDNGCYALGTLTSGTTTGPVLLAGHLDDTQPDSWAIVPPPSGVTFNSLAGIACVPGTTPAVCELAGIGTVGAQPPSPGILRITGNPSQYGTSNPATPQWSADAIGDASLLTLSGITCPSTTTCVASGTGNATSTSGPALLTGTIGSTSGSWAADTIPSTLATVTGLSCSGAACAAIGTSTSGTTTTPALVTETTASPTGTWTSATVPSGTTSLAAVACASATACVVTSVSASSTPSGKLLAGTDSSGTWTWGPATLGSAAAADSISYFTGIACGGTTCAATGETPTGAVVLTSTSGPGGTWDDATPAPASPPSGVTVTGIPISVNNSLLNPSTWNIQAPGQSPNPPSLPDLFPFNSGYAMYAGACSAQSTEAVTQQIASLPGNTSSATVPLALLPLSVVTSAGSPAAGVAATLTDSECGTPYTLTLPTTGPDGLVHVAVPYGKYTLTLTGTDGKTATSSLAVDTNKIVVGTTTVAMPGPVVEVTP